MLALEYLIFGTKQENTQSVINSFTSVNGPRRLAYLEALTKNLKAPANSMIYKWSKGGDGYVTTFIDLDGNDSQSSISVLIKQIQRNISRIKNERIGIPLGLRNSGIPQPLLVEGRFSNQSLLLIKAELEGIERAFVGHSSIAPNVIGLNYLLEVTQAKYGDKLLRNEIEDQFREIYLQIKSIDMALEGAVLTKKNDVQKLYEMVDKLEETINVNVVENLYLKN